MDCSFELLLELIFLVEYRDFHYFHYSENYMGKQNSLGIVFEDYCPKIKK
jgi:hypothetical protein